VVIVFTVVVAIVAKVHSFGEPGGMDYERRHQKKAADCEPAHIFSAWALLNLMPLGI
jgi:hypothetical protein